MFDKLLNKILDNPCFWDLSRYFLDLTCGLYRKRMTLLKDLSLFQDNPSVLDIGCGTGLFAEITQGDYVGIDSNCRNIERAGRKKYKKEKIFRCVGLDILLKEKAMFDVVIIIDLLHHLNNKECIDLLKVSAQLARKYLISFEPILKNEIDTLEKWILKHDKGANLRHLDDFNQLFQASGYKIIKSNDMRLGYLSTHLSVCCPDRVS